MAISTFSNHIRYLLTIGLIIFNSLQLGISKPKVLTLQGFQPMTGSGWTGGAGCLPGAEMALRHVNERVDILDGYRLTYSWVDTKCNPGLATYKMFQALNHPPTKIMLLGCGCSTESEATAQVSHLFNVTQLSYGSASPILSDRKRFPNFFRLGGPDQKLNPAKIALLNEFNWRRVATINQALEFFSVVTDDFVNSVKGTEISIISQEIFEHDPLTRVENLKKHDARIIITACYEDKARLLLCYAYKKGLYGPKIVWIFNGWFSSQFWRQSQDDVPCTEKEMELAADGAFLTGVYFKNPYNESGISGLTVSDFETMYRQETTYDPAMFMFDYAGGPCYDHIWVAALALNCTDAYLKDAGYTKSLDQFTYEDSDINDIIMSCMANVSMIGITGSISFGEGADPIKNVKIDRIQGNQRVEVGSYLMDENPKRLQWKGKGIIWKGGHIPRDSTIVTYEEVAVPLPLFVTMSTLAALGILCALGFFVFNIICRNNRMVKMSSPNINNVLLLGCIMTYTTVFMIPTGMYTARLCKVRTALFCLGFTIAFGALFSKTWRVYKIFTNKQLLQMRIKDYQLIGMVCLLCGGVVLILVVWEIVGPQHLIVHHLTKEVTRTTIKSWMTLKFGRIVPLTAELAALKRLKKTYKLAPSFLFGSSSFLQVYLSGNDAEVRPFVSMCYSEYGVYFGWTIYIIEGLLLSFGTFLSWETRKVKIEALNDSRQIGMCIYNVVMLSAVALLLTLLLEEEVIMVYGVTSGCILIGTTMTQCIVFLPKVIAVYNGNTVAASVVTASSGTAPINSQRSSSGQQGISINSTIIRVKPCVESTI